MGKIITISRQYGSGGREIGSILAKELEIPFYDHELIERAAKESGFAKEVFENADKKATNSFLYSIAMGMQGYGNQELGFTHLSLDDRIYLAQSEVIRKLGQEGPCIIVGRCADFVLKELPDVITVFIWADIEFRKKRAMKLDGLDEETALERIHKIDKRRKNYYNYHASNNWGKTDNYHLSLRSDTVGIENCANIIKSYVECAGR